MEQPVDATLSLALHRLLKVHYGYDSFRAQQEEAISATITGRDCLLILPTGGGKSITFQLAPLYRNQICVVLTPLLALGKDQVERCLELGIDAAIWSSETQEEKKRTISRELLADFEDTSLRLLYTTPESLCKDQLRELLLEAHKAGKLSSLAVDEAHCVSEWGHDFRPAYLTIGEVRELFKGLPCIAVTATATQHVRKSIIEQLRLKNPMQLMGSFNRPNIEYQVRLKELIGDGGQEAVLQDVLAFLRDREGQCGIIYARLRKTCDWLASELQSADIEAEAYHAGKDAQQRSRVQSGWSEGAFSVVVATIAFGMGIDKSDVRYVVHWDAPASIEGLYQESGRAGRDGCPAMSLLYASNKELKEAKKMEKGCRQGATGAVAAYIQEARCRRRGLLAYFDERRGPCDASAGDVCCDFCQDPQVVRLQLRQLDKKLEAAAAAERAAAPDEDPYDRCDAGSDGGAATAQQEDGSREQRDRDSPPDEAPDVFRTAKQLSAAMPRGAAAGPRPGRLPTLGLRRTQQTVRPRLQLRKPDASPSGASPSTANADASAAPAGQAASCSTAAAASTAGSEEQQGGSYPAPAAGLAAAPAGSGTSGALQPRLKRPPFKPLLPNRFKRPAMAAAAPKLTPGASPLPAPQAQDRAGAEAECDADAAPAVGQEAAAAEAAGASGAECSAAQSRAVEELPALAPRLVGGLKRGRGGFKPPLLAQPQPK